MILTAVKWPLTNPDPNLFSVRRLNCAFPSRERTPRMNDVNSRHEDVTIPANTHFKFAQYCDTFDVPIHCQILFTRAVEPLLTSVETSSDQTLK
jgi:hypothetical protein